jgi:hypothetical protein
LRAEIFIFYEEDRTRGTGNFELQEVTLMCRNIKTLFNYEPPVTDEEIRAGYMFIALTMV